MVKIQQWLQIANNTPISAQYATVLATPFFELSIPLSLTGGTTNLYEPIKVHSMLIKKHIRCFKFIGHTNCAKKEQLAQSMAQFFVIFFQLINLK